MPWVTQAAGGEKVRGFGRKHLYGALGILITAGITQKRQITDHWGTGPFDDFPMVRNCMPRDVFLLFYSRLFHVVSELEHVEEDDPGDESGHHIRYVNLGSLGSP